MKRKEIASEKDEHFFAFDLKGNLHCAKDCNYIDNRKYQCLDREHTVKLVKCRARLNKRKFRDYFAHIVKRGNGSKKNCGCCKYVDSLKIRNAKQALANSGKSIAFPVKSCKQCNMKVNIIADHMQYKILVKPVQLSRDKKWKYDCLLVDTLKNNKIKAVIEIVDHTYTPIPKLIDAFYHRVYLVEIPLEELKDLDHDSEYPISLNNVHVIRFLCQDCVYKEYTKERLNELEHEVIVWNDCDNIISHVYFMQSIINKSNLDVVDINEYAMSMIMNMKPWIVKSNFLNDSVLKIRKNGSVFKNALHYGCLADSCYGLIYVALLDCWNFSSPSEQQIKNIMYTAKQKYDIDREFVVIFRSLTFFYNREKILHNEISSNTYEIKDIRWAVCMEMEKTLNVCARCGKHGHKHNACLRKVCLRCRRFNHLDSECFAKSDKEGNLILSCGTQYRHTLRD